MSFKLGGIVIEDLNRDISAHEKLILAIYASFARNDGTSIKCAKTTVAKMARCSDRQVRRAVEKFVGSGVMALEDKDGPRGKWRWYRLDIDRALECHGPEKKPESSSGNTANVSDTQSGNPDSESGSNEREADSQSGGPDSQSVNPDSCSGNPGNPGLNPSAPSGAAAKDAAPAGARWKAMRSAMVEKFGEDQVGAWLDPLIPASDDGTTLVLWGATRFIVEYVATNFLEGLHEIFGGRVECIVHNLTQAAASERAAQIDQEKQRSRPCITE